MEESIRNFINFICMLMVAFSSSALAQEKGLLREAGKFQSSTNVAVVVGVEQYDEVSSGVSRLNYSADDAVRLSTVLQQNHYAVKRLIDHQAGKHQILAAIEDAGRNIDLTNGTLIFSFSGHGFANNGQNFLMSSGATTARLHQSALALNEVIAALRKTGAKRIVVFIDACRDIPGQKSISRGFVPQNGQGVQVLFSTQFGNVSWESRKLNQGVFSYYLAKGLAGEASGGDGIVEFNELAEYVESNVRTWTFQNMNKTQQPFHRSIGELYGRFVITAKGRFALEEQKLLVQQQAERNQVKQQAEQRKWEKEMQLRRQKEWEAKQEENRQQAVLAQQQAGQKKWAEELQLRRQREWEEKQEANRKQEVLAQQEAEQRKQAAALRARRQREWEDKQEANRRQELLGQQQAEPFSDEEGDKPDIELSIAQLNQFTVPDVTSKNLGNLSNLGEFIQESISRSVREQVDETPNEPKPDFSGRSDFKNHSFQEDISVLGSDDVVINGDFSRNIKIMGSGDVTVKGDLKGNIIITGSGNVVVYGNVTGMISLTGSGDVSVGGNITGQVSVVGSGDVNYGGQLLGQFIGR